MAGPDAQGQTPGALAADRFESLHRAELPAIVRFQGTGKFGLFMRGLSELGPGRFVMLVLAVILFAVDPRLAARLTVFVLFGLWLRELLALSLQSPRPYWIESQLRTFGAMPSDRTSFGLPSGHAMMGAAFWLYLAAEVNRRWAWIGAGLIAFAIGISRVYLAAHFFTDVLLGWAVGVAYFLIFRRLEPAGIRLWHRMGKSWRWLGILGVTAGMVVTAVLVRELLGAKSPAAWGTFGTQAHSLRSFATLAGGLCGTALGVALLRTWAGAGGAAWLRLLRVVLAGMVVRGLLEPLSAFTLESLSAVSSETLRVGGTFVVQAAKAWIVWYVLPRIFIRMRLADPEPVTWS